MTEKEVKVFDAYKASEHIEYYEKLGIEDYCLFEYHNQIVDKKGLIKPVSGFFKKLQPIKPLEEDLEIKHKYELDSEEKTILSILKSSTKKAEDLYDSCKRKETKYYKMLEDKFIDNYRNNFDRIFYGEHWDCNLSPFGHCLYHYDKCGESVCIFCGEPEERK